MKKKIKHYFFVQSEIERYGYRFSMRRFYQVTVFSVFLVIALGFVFNLGRVYLGVVIIAMIGSLPKIITDTYKGLDSQQRFNDLNNYLEQLLMSFARRSNLLIAIQETRQIFPEGQMAQTLDQVINHIENAPGNEVYREGLLLVEAKYSCSRLKKVHDFLMEVEKIGGNYGDVLNLIDQERLLWQERIYLIAASKKQIEKNIYLSCLMATIIAAVMGLILPRELNVFALDYLQQITTVYLVAVIAVITMAHSLLSGGYFNELNFLNREEYEKHLGLYRQRGLFNKTDLVSLAALLALMVVLLLTGQLLGGGLLGLMFVFVLIKTGSRRKRSLRTLKSNLNIAFMYWLLDISLLLQNNNIHVAIKQSIATAPPLLQNDLKSLNANLEKWPNSIKPYQEFLNEFDLPDVKSVMRNFYALDKNGVGGNGKFLNDLIARNNHLVDKTEKIALESKMAYINVFQYLPMLLATFKLLGDLVGFMLVLIIKMKGG